MTEWGSRRRVRSRPSADSWPSVRRPRPAAGVRPAIRVYPRRATTALVRTTRRMPRPRGIRSVRAAAARSRRMVWETNSAASGGVNQLSFERCEYIVDRHLSHASIDLVPAFIRGDRVGAAQHLQRAAVRAVPLWIGGAEDRDSRFLQSGCQVEGAAIYADYRRGPAGGGGPAREARRMRV